MQWNDEVAGAEVIRTPVEGTPHEESAAEGRRMLLEKLANYDDAVMDALLSGERPSLDSVHFTSFNWL